jgi:hypothetical protein
MRSTETDSGPTQSRPTKEFAAEILEEAASESSQVPTKVARVTEAYRFEQTVISALRQVAGSVAVGQEVVEVIANGTVAIDVRYTRTDTNPGFLQDSIDRVASRLFGPIGRVDGVKHLLVVTNTEVPSWMETGEASNYADQVRVVHWSPRMGVHSLRQALKDLV